MICEEDEEVCIPSEQPVLYAMRQAWVNVIDVQRSSLPDVMELSINAFEMSMVAVIAWFSVFGVLAWPAWATLSESYAVVALVIYKAWKRVVPWACSAFMVFYHAMKVLWEWEKIQHPSVWFWQAGFLSLCTLGFALYKQRTEIQLHLGSTRAWWQSCVKRARQVRLKFIASLRKRSDSAVQLLPSICYWGGSFAVIYMYPSYVSNFVNDIGWYFVSLILPLVETLAIILSSGASLSAPLFDVERILLYWVIYAMLTCVGNAVLWVPGAQFLINLVPLGHEITFFILLWLQLPHVMCRPSLAYGTAENALYWWNAGHVHRKRISQALSVFVILGIFSQHRAQYVATNIADSWQLLPAFLLFLLPYPFLELGCFYTGHLVPALNTTMAMKSHQTAKQQPKDLELKFRWISYWCIFASFKLFILCCSSILDWIPLRKQGEILFYVWLQLPYFRGSIRIVGGMIGLVEQGFKFVQDKKEVTTFCSSKDGSSSTTSSSLQCKADKAQQSAENKKNENLLVKEHLISKKLK